MIAYSPVAVTVALASAVPLRRSGWATSITYGTASMGSVAGSIVTVAPGSIAAPARPASSRRATTAATTAQRPVVVVTLRRVGQRRELSA